MILYPFNNFLYIESAWVTWLRDCVGGKLREKIGSCGIIKFEAGLKKFWCESKIWRGFKILRRSKYMHA